MPHSDSSPPAFDRLAPAIQQWIREQGWEELRDIQSRSISAVLDSTNDLLIAADTAAGKTEAAFLPLLSQVAERSRPGASVLYVSPLKALINDQFRRLDLLCERMEIDVVRWHGDAPQAAKQRALRNPGGVILITPESIEALLVRRPGDAKTLLGGLDAVIVDEIHAFLHGPRGLQLSSLLARIDRLSDRRPRRLGLSATLGDPGIARIWMNPDEPESVQLLQSSSERPELKLQIRALVREPDEGGPDDLEGDKPVALDRIADHAISVLRGANNLFFAGSRRGVEAVADRLRRRCESARVPNEFFPHHGSLSKALREELELRLKAGDLPTTAVATTTLELGVDIGSVKSVAQLGAPRSLAGLRQRLGRSGRRRGTPAILRIYVREPHPTADLDCLERLSLQVVQSVAAIRLLLSRFVEPHDVDPALFSVALHQTLSIISQEGGARADDLYRKVTSAAPFRPIRPSDYITLLRHMADPEQRLVEQAPDGLIMLGEIGERIVAGRDFYAVFQSDEEWRLVASGRTLGAIPLANAVAVGGLLVFAGQRWRITTVDDQAKVLEVQAHRAGRLPKFENRSVEPLHDRLVDEMRSVYLDEGVPAYLDPQAAELLAQGRTEFQTLGLADSRIIPAGSDTHVLTWRGTSMNTLLALAFLAAGMQATTHEVGVTIADVTPKDVRVVLGRLAASIGVEDIAQFVENLDDAKYDAFVPDELLRDSWLRRHMPLETSLQELMVSLSGAGHPARD